MRVRHPARGVRLLRDPAWCRMPANHVISWKGVPIMRRQWIIGGIVLLAIAAIASAIYVGDPPDRWDDHDAVRVVQVDENGNAVPGQGNTIIVERDGRGFFPFFPIVPLLGFLLVFLLIRAFVFRGGPPHHRGWGGPDPQWLDDWHRRQHQNPPAD